MDPNIAVIEKFYSAFAQRNAAGMNACYSPGILFYDPVFEQLRGDEAKAMWQMLCNNAKDLSLTFSNIKDLGEGYYTCDWQAAYTFSATGKKVINNCKAHMKIVNGIITEHSDAFSFHRWAAQAFGFKGWLIGGTNYFRQKVRNGARKNLLAFMNAAV